jgi:hypothetical protein
MLLISKFCHVARGCVDENTGPAMAEVESWEEEAQAAATVKEDGIGREQMTEDVIDFMLLGKMEHLLCL